MKGIILAAGKGTRLFPASSHISKILFPIYDKPMIYYPLSTLMSAGIRDILIIVSRDDRSYFKKLLGDGKQFGISIKYAVQRAQKGIADALIIGERFTDGDSVALALGDNVFYGKEMYELLAQAMSNTDGVYVFCHEVDDGRAFGIAEFDSAGNIVNIEEKPKEPRSNLAVVGLYFYDKECSKLARALRPSVRGELEITDLNNLYLKRGKLKALVTNKDTIWVDTGTPDSLLDASNKIHEVEKTGRAMVGCPEEIALRMGYITKKQLCEWIRKRGADNAYYNYLRALVDEE